MADKKSQSKNGNGAPAQSEPVRKTPFSDEELEHFKELILKRRKAAKEDIQRMREQIEEAKCRASSDTSCN